MSKPLVDITIYAVKLSSSIGPEGPLLMISYLMALGLFLPWVRQPTSRFTMTEQQMKGTFRFMKSRLSTHSEENALTWAFSWSIPKTSNRVCPPRCRAPTRRQRRNAHDGFGGIILSPSYVREEGHVHSLQ
ncbi:hypothetical protein PR003_g6407 [Phytophthora rubi]|uniref:ABC transmembrane type-1 domain-containing protein n=1 Tax=Phytophthora rubi TaxID=129364 RepID=A0A6A4FWW6_9STRA|nr:hypothetical protein PR003_g6407 [Phytophthora rubi]